MPQTFKLDEHSELEFALFSDEEARANLRYMADNLRSKFLDDVLFTKHQRQDDVVSIFEHCICLVCLYLPRNRLIGFIALEDEQKHSRINLHLIYVLRGYRRRGYGKLLLSALDWLACCAEINLVRTVATSSVALRMLQKHASTAKGVQYEIVSILPEELVIEDLGFELR